MRKRKILTIVAIIIILVSWVISSGMSGLRAESNQVDTSKWDIYRVSIFYDTNYKPVPVPKGYVASSVLTERNINKGFVIYEGTESVTEENIDSARKERNQWVWVPVSNVDSVYTIVDGVKKGVLNYNYDNYREQYSEPEILTRDGSSALAYYLAEYNQVELYEELKKDFDDILNSIRKYGGFYIARYETSVKSTGQFATVKGANSYQYTWYSMYKGSKSVIENENKNLKTSMIWGFLWDCTLKWLVDSGCKTTSQIYNSRSWGNYEDVEFNYTDYDGNTVAKTGWKKIPTGSAEFTKANNIYDLAGNVWEWTTSGKSNVRTLRGGTYYDYQNRQGSVESYWNYDPTYTASGQSAGSRAILYIK